MKKKYIIIVATATMGNTISASADIPTKECAACGKSKPLTEYHNNSKRPDGKRDRCPDCIEKKKPRIKGNPTTPPISDELGHQAPQAPQTPQAPQAPQAPQGSSGYMYVIIEREFIKTNESIYKIGMTNQYDPRKRLQNYPHDSRVLLLIEKNDARRSENIVKDLLRAHREIKHRTDIGAEYFEGDPSVIVNIVFIA